MNQTHNHKKGFTLLEIIITLLVIATLSGMSLASYFNFNQQQILENERAALVEKLELAKKKALSIDRNLTVGGVDYSSCDINGYKIVINSATDYSLAGRACDNTGSCPLSSGCSDIVLSTFTLNKSITMSPTSGEVYFNARVGKPEGLTSLTVSHINTNQSKTITINLAGVIE